MDTKKYIYKKNLSEIQMYAEVLIKFDTWMDLEKLIHSVKTVKSEQLQE